MSAYCYRFSLKTIQGPKDPKDSQGPSGAWWATQRASTFLRGAGGDIDAATQKAGIVGDLSDLANRSSQPKTTLTTADVNSLASRYTSDAGAQVKALTTDGTLDPATGQQLQGALQNAQGLNDSQVAGRPCGLAGTNAPTRHGGARRAVLFRGAIVRNECRRHSQAQMALLYSGPCGAIHPDACRRVIDA